MSLHTEIIIGEKTVEYYQDHTYTKLAVRTRLTAGPWAMHQGMKAETREIPSYGV